MWLGKIGVESDTSFTTLMLANINHESISHSTLYHGFKYNLVQVMRQQKAKKN